MLFLAIDTSGKQGSIALARGDESADDGGVEVIGQATLSGGAFSAQLIPQIAELLSRNQSSKSDVGAFAVVSGPGSFTGLRVGLAGVKALAEISRQPIVELSLLEVYADASGVRGKILAALDAGRSEVYAGEYELPSGPGQAYREYVAARSDFVDRARDCTVVSPDENLLELARSAGARVLKCPYASAADAARLGWRKLRAGLIVSPERLEANYLRRTDAELLEESKS